MNIFKGQNLLEFSDRLKTDNDCKKYLAEIKWKDDTGESPNLVANLV